MSRAFYKYCVLVAVCSILECSYANTSDTTFELTFAHYDRSFQSNVNDRSQTGTGAIFRHRQGFLRDRLELKAGVYAAQKWSATGLIREDLFPLENSHLASFELLGEASVAWSLAENVKLEVGRFEHSSLLLKSKTRVLPSTFQGANFYWSPSDAVHLYGHRFTKWSRRANSDFEEFGTNNSVSGAIAGILILGASFEKKLSDSIAIRMQSEFLEANDYLRKFGFVGSVSTELDDEITLKVKAGLFSSRDAGALFINGANDALDIIPDMNSTNKVRIEHRGLGGYLSSFLALARHRFGLSYVQFGQPWLEDNFADDHGTTPFPSRTYGPDLTNAKEHVWVFEYQHQWRDGALQGLVFDVAFAEGRDIENSISSRLGQAKEYWYEFDIKYQLPMLKNLITRLRYRNYDSDIIGDVAGVSDARHETRFTVNYEYRF